MVKRLPTMWETQVWSLCWEVPLEKEMATHSSILAWRIPWTEEPEWATVHGVVKSRTWLSDFTSFHFMPAYLNSYLFKARSLVLPFIGGQLAVSPPLYLLDLLSNPSKLSACSLFPFSLSISLPLALLLPVQPDCTTILFWAIPSSWHHLFCSLKKSEDPQPLIISAICTNCLNTGATRHYGENSSATGTDIKANLESEISVFLDNSVVLNP